MVGYAESNRIQEDANIVAAEGIGSYGTSKLGIRRKLTDPLSRLLPQQTFGRSAGNCGRKRLDHARQACVKESIT